MFNVAIVPAWFWIFSTACFGAVLGSYVNMAAYRLPRGISTVTRTRSFCPSCNTQLSWYENIPILSYLALLGRCRHCRKSIGTRYLVTELIVTALFILSAYQFFALNNALHLPWVVTVNGKEAANWELWRLIAVFAVQMFFIVDMVLLSVVDLELWIIPPQTTIPWILVGFIIAPVFPELHAHATTWVDSPIGNALIDSFMGMVLGAGVLWGVGFATTFFTFYYYRFRARNERPKEGMGMGDVHLMAMVGAMLGWKPVLATVFIAVFVGSVTGISKILWERFQQNRLGDQYKPWQPTYEMPQDDADPGPPSVWPLLVAGIVLLIATALLFEQSDRTFSYDHEMFNTMEEAQLSPLPPVQRVFDVRLAPVYLMGFLGGMLVFSSVFLKYLTRIDMLPQGSIVEKEGGQKEEVLQGNYVPFGPSLAAAALIVVFYEPLIRGFAWWFSNGAAGRISAPAYKVVGQDWIIFVLQKLFGMH